MSETTELTTGVDSYVLRGDQWHRVREDGTLGSRVAQYAGPELVDALDALAAAQEEARNMREALEKAQQIAREAYTHWDADRDSKVGKLLAALGGTRGIRPDFDTLIADNPHAPASYKESLKDLPPEEYKRFVEGDWTAISDGRARARGGAMSETTRDSVLREFVVYNHGAMADALAAARRENETMRGWLSHLLSCLTCAEDGLSCCETGRDIDAALRGEGGSGDAK